MSTCFTSTAYRYTCMNACQMVLLIISPKMGPQLREFCPSAVLLIPHSWRWSAWWRYRLGSCTARWVPRNASACGRLDLALRLCLLQADKPRSFLRARLQHTPQCRSASGLRTYWLHIISRHVI